MSTDTQEQKEIEQAADIANNIVIEALEHDNEFVPYSIFVSVISALSESGMTVEEIMNDVRRHLTDSWPIH